MLPKSKDMVVPPSLGCLEFGSMLGTILSILEITAVVRDADVGVWRDMFLYEGTSGGFKLQAQTNRFMGKRDFKSYFEFRDKS